MFSIPLTDLAGTDGTLKNFQKPKYQSKIPTCTKTHCLYCCQSHICEWRLQLPSIITMPKTNMYACVQYIAVELMSKRMIEGEGDILSFSLSQMGKKYILGEDKNKYNYW